MWLRKNLSFHATIATTQYKEKQDPPPFLFILMSRLFLLALSYKAAKRSPIGGAFAATYKE